jgi:hypothetical protein
MQYDERGYKIHNFEYKGVQAQIWYNRTKCVWEWCLIADNGIDTSEDVPASSKNDAIADIQAHIDTEEEHNQPGLFDPSEVELSDTP